MHDWSDAWSDIWTFDALFGLRFIIVFGDRTIRKYHVMLMTISR